MESDKLRQQETEDIMTLILPEIGVEKVISKKAAADELKLPPIGGKAEPKNTSKPTPPTPLAEDGPLDALQEDELGPVLDEASEKDKLLQEVQSLKDALQDLERETRLKTLEEDIELQIDNRVKSLKKEIEELKDRKVPERGQIETDNAYREQLYPIAINLLNKILIPLVDIVPSYNLIGTSITNTYEDGTIKNAVVTINISIPNNDFRYDFKVDMIVLNGLMQYPTYVTRGRKIIPLTRTDMYTEINSYSFKPLDIATRYKGNPFSNTGENIHRKHDTQKFYPVEQNQNEPVGVTENSRWNAYRTRGLV